MKSWFYGNNLKIVFFCCFSLDHKRTVDVFAALNGKVDSLFFQDWQNRINNNFADFLAGSLTDMSAADFAGAASQYKDIARF